RFRHRRRNKRGKRRLLSTSNGVLIDSSFAESHGYNIGDTIQIELTAYSLSFETQITGTMCYAEATSTKSVCPIYISIAQNQGLLPFFNAYANQALVKTGDVAYTRQAINNHYSDQNNLLFILDMDTTESFTLLENEVSQSKAMIYVFPVIFLFVSVLVILTTISQLILRERMNIGTLKALGYSNPEIASHYSSVGIIVTLFGALIGVMIGPKIIPHVMEVKYELVYNLPAYDGVIYSILWSFAAILAVGLLSASLSFLICRDVLKETPAQCMRPKAPKNMMMIRLIGGDGHDEPVAPVD
ncbi:MAG TPA: ABC transporter permease, partial [Candidatus Izemoplasmatales bacterium]|nr:ABC transporter permease [Candidatus Izemoplasmatales bacterium]